MSTPEEYGTLIEKYQSAARCGDFETIASLFAEDAMFFNPDSPAILGRESIRQDYAASIGDGFDVTITLDDVNDCGDVVYASGGLEYGDGPKKWLQVSRRQNDGSLLIHRLIWN